MIDAKRRSALDAALPDDFSRKMVAGALRAAADTNNPVRAHLFAAAWRELMSHVLQNAAPDVEVRACSWFEQAKDTEKITRRQRAVYATQGGFADAYIEALGVDVSDLHKEAVQAIETLNKATHVREKNLLEAEEDVIALVEVAVAALEGLLASFASCRNAITERLENDVYKVMIDAFIERTFDEINLVASHGYELNPFVAVDDVSVKSISSTEIVITISGEAPIKLHYGKGDDAAEIDHDFPFFMTFNAPIDAPTNLSFIDCVIDDSGWYEG